MLSDAIEAITESLPPATDYLTYLTIVESHLSPELLPTLNNILQDAELTQNIGWDLIHVLLPLSGAEECLASIARLGNPREVILKVTESLQLLELDSVDDSTEDSENKVPTAIDQFCVLINLLSILHPRIKTKYPSRFLSTTLIAILTAFRPSNQATLAVISFLHTISGKKRPSLPGRKSSLNIPTKAQNSAQSDSSAPDPEAQEEDPQEAAIQKRLLQSFVTHILEEYINSNPLEWAARLHESFEPEKVVSGRRSWGEAYLEDPVFATRDTIAGQLVALTRDLGLSQYSTFFEAIYDAESYPSEYNQEDNYPSSPGDIPLSKAGSLFVITSFIFSSVLFESKTPELNITIFPDHDSLVKQFIDTETPEGIGREEPGVIDAILAIGIFLEHNNNFVSGPLEDEDFLQHLRSLSLLSANTPSDQLRYAAHVLTSSILHAHPVDRLRLTFITETLQHDDLETLKASAVSWLKEEIITAHERKSSNAFASTVALTAVQPYLFLDSLELGKASAEDLVQRLSRTFPFDMAVINFIYFIRGIQYEDVVPPGMMASVEELYLGPLKNAQEKAVVALESKSPEGTIERDNDDVQVQLQLLGERIGFVRSSLTT